MQIRFLLSFYFVRFSSKFTERQLSFFIMPFQSKYLDYKIPEISLHEFLLEKIRKGNERVALIDNHRNGKSITFREIGEYSRSCAGFLHKQGLKKGDRVGVCAYISVGYPVVLLGILACGATVVFCNPEYSKNEILQQFKISKPKMVFVDKEALETVKLVQKEMSCIEKIFVNVESEDFTTFNKMIRSEHAKDFPIDVQIDPTNDIALLPYSSGTTGLPKGVMITHGNMVSCLAIKSAIHMEENDTFYLDRPIYHSGGFTYFFLALTATAKAVCNRVDDVEVMLRAVEKYKVTRYVTVPSFMVRFAESDVTDKYDTSSLEKVVFGSASTAPNAIRKMKEKLGVQPVECYGATETLAITLNTEFERYPTSTGTLFPNTAAKIVDLQTDQELPSNKSGEILVKSPMVLKGYLNNDEANRKAFTDDGWFRTGDIGYFDEDERLYIIGRIKEVIKYKSVQVSPAELESVILKLPQVTDVGVIGIPHVLDGEIPKAFVVRKDNSLSADQIYAFVKDELADYKQLRGGISFVDSIPKSPTGKIQRNELKKMAGLV